MKQSMHMILLYLDPGSGAMIVQAFIAGTLGAVMFFKNIKIRVLSFLGVKTKSGSDDSRE